MRVCPVGKSSIVDGKLKITGADARHIATVLRKRPGDRLKVAVPDDGIYDAVIEEYSRNIVIARVTGKPETVALKKPAITLALSISKPAVMELVAQKAVELGCVKFIPAVTRRSLSDTVSPSRFTRLEKIIHEAGKQCGRSEPMELSPALPLPELPPADFRMVLWEEEESLSLRSALAKAGEPESALLLVGPAGGFEKEEIESLKNGGFKTAGLGSLILRTETAALTVLAVVNHHFGRMEP